LTHTRAPEQTTGWYTMLEERLALPFETTMLGVVVIVATPTFMATTISSPSARALASGKRSTVSICRYHGPGQLGPSGSRHPWIGG